MSTILAIMLLLVTQAGGPPRHRIELEPLLNDPAALQKLTVTYYPPVHDGWAQRFFVRGNGSLILQAHPDRPMSLTGIPTCRNKVSTEKVKDLLRLIIKKHFFDLPERDFIFVYAKQGKEELELHTIAIDDGLGKVSRTFGIGKFAGKEESVPEDFSAIEEELKRLRDSAFLASEKPCHLAPAIQP